MENDIYNETKRISKITENNSLENLIIQKRLIFNNIPNINLNDYSNTIETSSHTASSRKNILFNLKKEKENTNKLDLKKNLNILFSQDNSNKPSVRKDNYGKEIKKGGKHKIAFADDLKLIQSLMGNESIRNSAKKPQYFSPSKTLEDIILPITRTTKRSNTFKNNRISTVKNIYNIFKKNLNNKQKLCKPLVNVINIQCIKEETKVNTYFFRNKTAEEEQVCCSCYCSIY